MKMYNLPKTENRLKKIKRLGCGRGSGHGKTSARGHKGGNARSGYSTPSNFSGIPLYRRLPKRGFNNVKFKTYYQLVCLSDLEKRLAQDFTNVVDRAVLLEFGMIDEVCRPVKLLGNGNVTRALSIQLDKVSAGAKLKIESAGGRLVTD